MFTLTSIDMILLVYKTRTKRTYKFKSIQSLILVIMIIVLFGVRRIYINNNLNSVNDGWNSNNVISNDSNYYQNWNSPTRLVKICGIYEYLIKDFYNSFIKKDNSIEARLFVNNYIDENYKEDNNEYTGIFKDKNLIFVMMESMDDWLVNENVTPTMYMMMQHGFNFNNHYSPGYVTGDTANTEFIANTGMYPVINKLSPNYAYVNNSYPYSIANLFKNEDYTVNSFHRSGGGIYNRENMHISLGYEKYYNYVDMGISDDNLDLDSYIIKDGYDKIISDNKFMSFIITYSPHSPYTYNKIECQTNLSDIKTIYPELDNEELLCAYSAARETDNMFKLLLEKLKNDNLLDDTIIVAFTDHPNKLVIRDDETEKLNKTIFYIYDHEMNSNQIDTITSSINILPTVINLFDIKNNYLYSGYDALDTNEEYVIFKDYTYFDGKEVKTVTKEYKDKLEYSSDILSSDYYKDNTVKK
ncbi:MAG: LTA synthase family protein [Bacilli bacterium]|nr:LTA synthase family protein [Bacilli bacterium]